MDGKLRALGQKIPEPGARKETWRLEEGLSTTLITAQGSGSRPLLHRSGIGTDGRSLEYTLPGAQL